MLSLQKKIIFSLFTPQFFIQKLSILDEQGGQGGAGQKFEDLSEHTV